MTDATWTPERVRALRERLGMTQQQFAVEVGTVVPTVSRWENGHQPVSPMAARLLTLLDGKKR